MLLDENIDKKLKELLSDVDISCETVKSAGFRGKSNGELLALAEELYDVFVTMDTSIRKQQNLVGRKISLLLIRARTNRIADVIPYVPEIKDALRNIKPGEFREVGWVKSQSK